MLSVATSELPAVSGGLASLPAGGFEITETVLGSTYDLSRVFGVINMGAVGNSFDWGRMLPGALGNAMKGQVRSTL